MKLSVIMPVLNEASTVEAAIARVLKRPEVAELIVVNGASTDEKRLNFEIGLP